MAQVFATEEAVVEGGTAHDAARFLDEVLRTGREVPGLRRGRRRERSVTLAHKPTLLAPTVRIAVTAEAHEETGVLVLRWSASVRSLPGGAILEGDVLDGSRARYAVEGRAGARNERVLAEFDRVAFRPAVESVRRAARA